MRRRLAALGMLAVVGFGATGWSQTPQSPPPPPAPRQTVLPFTGLESPHEVAVDTAGNVYITDIHHFTDDRGFPDATNKVIELAAGSNTQTVLPFTGSGLVVDPAGAVWVVDGKDEQLVKLPAGPNPRTVLPLPDLGVHGDVLAVDTAGNAFGTSGGGVDPSGGCCVPVHVVKSAGRSNPPTVLPFTDINGVGGMAVDAAGNVYVGDDNRVLKLAAGSNTPTVLPFSNGGVAVAVDSADSVYVVDAEHNRVLKLPAGSNTPTELPFTGINHPVSVAVDTAGNVYVVDLNRRVLKLEAH